MESNQVESILFFGAGEVAELAYLYLQLTDIRLVGIIDDSKNGHDFFELKIDGFGRLNQRDWDKVLLTRLDDTDRDVKSLLEMGVELDKIAIL
jgi:hypothetical protein